MSNYVYWSFSKLENTPAQHHSSFDIVIICEQPLKSNFTLLLHRSRKVNLGHL